jgi:clan AA aspartic protease (TIGR02281 family)
MSGYVLLSEPRSWAGIAGASAIVVAAITAASAGLIPHRHTISIPADRNRQYWTVASFDSQDCRSLVDSGAAGNAFITREMAKQLKMTNLHFVIPFSSANGLMFGARSWVSELRVGTVTFHDVPVIVAGGKLDYCLLGAAWIDRFHGQIGEGYLHLDQAS